MSTDFVSPLAKARASGSARSGTGQFLIQRASAIALIPLLVFAGMVLADIVGASRVEALARLGHPVVAGLVALTMIIVAMHMRAGVQMVLEDYVQTPTLRALAALANLAFAIFVGPGAAVALLWIVLEARG